MRGVPHHLLDVWLPSKTFTAAEFVKRARVALDDMIYHNRLPIVCGGTGFYIDALIGRMMLPNVPPNPKLRARLEEKSPAQLFMLLKRRDAGRAKTIDPHNKRRLVRAIEITDHRPHNDIVSRYNDLRCRYDVLWIGIAPPKKELEKKIRARLLARMKQGMIAEAKQLHARGLSYKRMGALGLEYRSLARFLQRKITRAQMLEELGRDIRRYAKRQMTYWRRNKDIAWFDEPNMQRMAWHVKRWRKK